MSNSKPQRSKFVLYNQQRQPPWQFEAHARLIWLFDSTNETPPGSFRNSAAKSLTVL
jgi:hypothetical protein